MVKLPWIHPQLNNSHSEWTILKRISQLSSMVAVWLVIQQKEFPLRRQVIHSDTDSISDPNSWTKSPVIFAIAFEETLSSFSMMARQFWQRMSPNTCMAYQWHLKSYWFCYLYPVAHSRKSQLNSAFYMLFAVTVYCYWLQKPFTSLKFVNTKCDNYL